MSKNPRAAIGSEHGGWSFFVEEGRLWFYGLCIINGGGEREWIFVVESGVAKR